MVDVKRKAEGIVYLGWSSFLPNDTNIVPQILWLSKKKMKIVSFYNIAKIN